MTQYARIFHSFKKIIGFFFSLIGLSSFACTIPVIDTEYKDNLEFTSTFMFKGKLWIMGDFSKTVSRKYNPRFLSLSNWDYQRKVIRNYGMYTVSDTDRILESALKARFKRSVTLDDRLRLEGERNDYNVCRDSYYYIEHNGKIFVVGGNRNREHLLRSHSEKLDEDIWRSEDGLKWQLVIKNPPWTEKWNEYDRHRITGLNGYIYLARSHRSGPGLSSIWRSKDGIEWEKITEISNLATVWDMFSMRGRLFLLGMGAGEEQVLFYSDDAIDWHRSDSLPAREYLSIVSCSEKLYGFSGSNLYTSEDGIKWKNIINSPNVPSKVIAFNGRLAALELFKGSGKYSPAYSTDGISWSTEGNEYKFSFIPEDLHSKTLHNYNSYNLVKFKDSIWIIGESPERIYRSRDGREWVKVNVKDDKRFIPRSKAAITGFQNKIWIIGGVWTGEMPDSNNTVGGRHVAYIVMNDVWSSIDGESWELVTDKAPWGARMDASAVEFNGKLFLVGGDRYGREKTGSEVWESPNGRAWINTSITKKDEVSGDKIRNHYAGVMVHNKKLHVFDIIAMELAISVDGQKFSKAALKEVKDPKNITSANIGGRLCYLSTGDRGIYLSWDLLTWKDLNINQSETWGFHTGLFSLHDKLYIVDVDFQKDVKIQSYPLKIDINKMTAAVEEN